MATDGSQQPDIRPQIDWGNPAASAPTLEPLATPVPSPDAAIANQSSLVTPDLTSAPAMATDTLRPVPPIESNGIGPVSRVTNPDGSTFDMIGSDPERATLRSDALMRMKELVAGNPELEAVIQNTAGVSAEYVMSALVQEAFSPELKAKLLEIYGDEAIAEGRLSTLVGGLSNANASELPVTKYDNAFLTGLFEEALSKDPSEAWSMAQRMMAQGKRVLKPAEVSHQSFDLWKGMEQKAFEAHAERVLAQEIPTEIGELSRFRADMQGLFGSSRLRPDGFKSEAQSELSKRIAEKMIQLDLAIGAPAFAYEDAKTANMPPARIEELRRMAYPGTLDTLRRVGASFTRRTPSTPTQ